MTKYRVTVRDTSAAFYGPVDVEAGSMEEAKRAVEGMVDNHAISTQRQVSDRWSSAGPVYSTAVAAIATYDADQARQEGWCLSERDDGIYEIQRLDTSEVFDSDAEALSYVWECANAGSPMHAAAIELEGTPWRIAREVAG